MGWTPVGLLMAIFYVKGPTMHLDQHDWTGYALGSLDGCQKPCLYQVVQAGARHSIP